MGFKKTIFLASAFALSAFAAPLPVYRRSGAEETDSSNNTTKLTAADLVAIAPDTASCTGAPFPEECAVADHAATALNESFKTYGITTTGEIAALVAYTLFESGDYKYSKNHFPGRPGQGTRMMAMPPFIKLYATAVAGESEVAAAEAAGGDAGLVNILALVNSDDRGSFGSAAWFLTTQCTADIRAGLVAETIDGWHNFLTVCVGTTAAPERDTPWVAAKQTLLGN